MADYTNNTANEATSSVIETLRETNQAIMKSAITAQEHNLAFAQSTFENGIEVLKSQAENNRTLMSNWLTRPENRHSPKFFRPLSKRRLRPRTRNIKYAQSIFENGIEVLKSQVSTAAICCKNWVNRLKSSRKRSSR